MSHTSLLAAPVQGPLVGVAVFANAWGSAAYVWGAVCRKVYGDESLWMTMAGRGKLDELWALHTSEKLTEVERLMMRWTFDACCVPRADFFRLSDLMVAFRNLHPRNYSSLPMQAEMLRLLAGDDHGLDFEPAYACWHQTSVSENPWWVRGEGEEEGEAYSPGAGDKHFLLFDPVEEG